MRIGTAGAEREDDQRDDPNGYPHRAERFHVRLRVATEHSREQDNVKEHRRAAETTTNR